jgi:hypothetical protein
MVGHRFSIRPVPSSELTLFSRALKSGGKPPHSKGRRGQALVEFALVALVVYMILAAILTFGQLLYCGQGLQQAADLAARELSRSPLPAIDQFNDFLTSTGSAEIAARKRIYNDKYLVLTIDSNPLPSPAGEVTYNGGHPIGDFPVVIQKLAPLMIYDQLVTSGTASIPVLRYPGAVFTDPNPDPTLDPPASGYLVRIPILTYPLASGPIPPGPWPGSAAAQQVGWVPVLEEIPNSAALNASSTASSSFPINSAQQGLVALRFNYPYQSASMSGFQPQADPTLPPGPPETVVNPISVNGTVYLQPPSDVGTPVVSALFEGFGPYGGQYSLGQQAAWAQAVRPYRHVISAQAIYRREVFSQ